MYGEVATVRSRLVDPVEGAHGIRMGTVVVSAWMLSCDGPF